MIYYISFYYGDRAELNEDEIEQYVRNKFKRLNASFLEASKKVEEHTISGIFKKAMKDPYKKCDTNKEKKRMLRLIQ